jgi:hypothetical protein
VRTIPSFCCTHDKKKKTSKTGLDRDRPFILLGWNSISPHYSPLSGKSHFSSFPLYFHYLYIYYLLISITFPIHPPVTSRPTFCLHLLSYFLPANPQLVLLSLILHFISLSIPLLSCSLHKHMCARTQTAFRFPFCFSNSSFHNMPQLHNQSSAQVHSVAMSTCFPCRCPIHLPWSTGSRSSKPSHSYQTTRCHMPEDSSSLYSYCHENIKSNWKMSLATFRFERYWCLCSKVFWWTVKKFKQCI